MKRLTIILLMFITSLSFATTSDYCETVVTHLNDAGQTASAIKLTITNVDGTSMYVEIESADSDPVDFLLVNNGSGATISEPDNSVAGKIKRTLSWATPPANVDVEILWSKESTGGNWMLNTFTVPFAASCTSTPIESDATLSDLKVGGTTISGFSSGTLNYTYVLASGEAIPAVTATATNTSLDASKIVITDATTVPGDATVVVTSQDDSDTKTYTVSFEYGLSLPFDFETAPVTSDFVSFDGGIATVIANPHSEGDNTSGNVAQIVRNGGAVWAGAKIVLPNNLDFSVKGGISMQVYTEASVGTKVVFKLEGSGAVEKEAYTTVSGAWETLTWDFTGQPANFNALVFLFDLGNTGDGTAASTFLFDDITQYEITQSTDATLSDLKVGSETIPGFSPDVESYNYTLADGAAIPEVSYTVNDSKATAEKTDATTIPGTTTVKVTSEASTTKTYSINFAYELGLPINFESKPVTENFINFDGGTTTVIDNPHSSGINTSGKVAQLVRSGGQVWAGSKLLLSNNLDFSVKGGISMKVYTDAPVGTKVAFKLENETNAGINKEISAFTTVTGEWETLKWDFTGETNEYKWLVFLFDLGNTGDGTAASTFLFDDIEQYEILFSNDASLSDLQVDGVTIEGFNSNTLEYTIKLAEGTTDIPQITSAVKNDENATVTITQADALPGSATVLVKAEDDTEQTYTVNFVVTKNQALPLTFEDAPYDITNFEGGQLTVVDNPQSDDNNSSAKVAQMIKGAGSGAAGAYITLTENIDFSEKPDIAVKVFSPRADATMLFKLEGAAGPVEKTVTSTVANEWETFTLDFKGTQSDVYNKIVIIFDLGTVGDGSADYTFLIDDIEQTGFIESTDATLSEILVDDEAIANFDAATLSYSIELDYGTTTVPTVTATATHENATVAVTPATALPGSTQILVTAEDTEITTTYTVEFTIGEPSTDATLSDLMIGEISIDNFDADVLDYEYELPYGTTDIPAVTVTTTNEYATTVIANTDSLPGITTITVTAQDEATVKTYKVSFTVATVISDDATLNKILIDSVAIEGFDPATLDYEITLPFGTVDVPTVIAVTNNLAANAVVTQAAELPGKATIVVTAQDTETTKTYTVSFEIGKPSYNVSFTVVDAESVAIKDAEVLFLGKTLKTDVAGIAKFEQVSVTADAAYTITKEGYITANGKLSVVDEDVELTVKLLKEIIPDPTYTVTFTVIDEAEAVIADAAVSFMGETVNTDADGKATFTEVADTTDAAYSVSKDGYELTEGTVTVNGEDAEVTVQLIAVGVNELSELMERIYPNPTNGVLNIELANDVDNAIFELIDLNGKILQKTELSSNDNRINLINTNEGVYMVRVSNKNYYQMSRIVIMF